jgi:hypothetical protein
MDERRALLDEILKEKRAEMDRLRAERDYGENPLGELFMKLFDLKDWVTSRPIGSGGEPLDPEYEDYEDEELKDRAEYEEFGEG